jgi:predicted nucleic acid-binding protein
VRLVVDASVLVEIALSGGRLEGLGGHDLIGPALLHSESASTLAELAWRGVISSEHARAAVDYVIGVPLRIVTPPGHFGRSIELAQSLGWAKTYDAEYLALAVHENATLVTLDARLKRGAGHVTAIIAPADVPAA